MLKQILLMALLFFIFCSCKKNYTCQCSTTTIYLASDNKLHSQTFPAAPEAYSEKLSKKQATDACKNMEGVIQSNLTNWYTINGFYTLRPGESIITTCAITF